jgi:hypothetical protein
MDPLPLRRGTMREIPGRVRDISESVEEREFISIREVSDFGERTEMKCLNATRATLR